MTKKKKRKKRRKSLPLNMVAYYLRELAICSSLSNAILLMIRGLSGVRLHL